MVYRLPLDRSEQSNMYRVSKRKWRQRITVIACCVIFFFILSKIIWHYPSNWEMSDVGSFEFFANDDPVTTGEQHERWIVITTIHSPTHAMKVMSELPGWWMVVVADKKTPKDWSIPSAANLVYLDLAKQKKLGYAVNTLLQQNNYARKTIGYIYAIQHGAHYIFDSDDDTVPIDQLQGFHLSNDVANAEGLLLDTKNLTYNPYPHFGQSTIWPRGYPLNRLTLSTPRDYKLCTIHNPVIRQGLINRDPDVDAVVRLTRKPAQGEMDMNFDSVAPPIVIPKGTFVPMNTQASVVAYEALWSLVLPQSLSTRTMDIMRGYWAQPLLWLIDQRVGYYTAVSVHERNTHDILSDAESEQGFYKVEHMLHVLSGWKCSRPHFFACVSDLTSLLVHEGIWETADLDLVNAWLTDLAMVGYYPPMIKDSRVRECADEEHYVKFYPTEQHTSLIHSPDSFMVPNLDPSYKASIQSLALCNHSSYVNSQLITSFHNVLVVIGVRSVEFIPVLETWYRTVVRNIVYCISGNQKPSTEVSFISLGDQKISPVLCIKYAIDLNANVTGYLYADDHSLLNVHKMSTLHQSQYWMSAEVVMYEKQHLEMCRSNVLQCKIINKQIIMKLSDKLSKLKAGIKLKTKLKSCFDNVASGVELQSDATALVDQVVYIPEHLQRVFGQLADLFLSDSSSEDYTLIIPLVLDCMEATPEALSVSSLYDKVGHYYFPAPVDKLAEHHPQSILEFCTAIRS